MNIYVSSPSPVSGSDESIKVALLVRYVYLKVSPRDEEALKVADLSVTWLSETTVPILRMLEID